MKTLFYFCICLVLISCDASPKDSNTPNQIQTASQQFNAPKATPIAKGILRPFTFNLKGSLGEEHPIDMYLSYPPNDLHQHENDHCVAITGDYLYSEQQASSFKLSGELCFDMGIATLHYKKDKQIIQSFKGKFDGQVHSIQGKWTHLKTEEHRVFELLNTCYQIPPTTLELFAQKLNEHLKSSKFCQLDQVGFDEKGIFIKNFKAKNLVLKDFSPTQFKWQTSEEVDAYNFDYNEIVDLWFYDHNSDFVIVIDAIDHIEHVNAKGDLEEKEHRKTEVWKYNGTSFENIYLEHPDAVDLSKIVWYATIANEKIQLYSNKEDGLWEW